jgi:hypothetical protein
MPESVRGDVLAFDKELLWSRLSEDERKRQESILELLVTEQNYLGRLETIKEVFMGPSEMVLTGAKEREAIFQNIDDLAEASGKLLKDLTERRSGGTFTIDIISDVFIRFVKINPSFTVLIF